MIGLTALPENVCPPVFMTPSGRPCTIERRSEYDSMGRCTFFLSWTDGDRERSQIFFARPDAHVSTVRTGSLWRHKSGAVFRVEEVASGNEFLMGVERFSADEYNRIIYEARQLGIDEREAIEAAKDDQGFMVEPAWFEHAATEVK